MPSAAGSKLRGVSFDEIDDALVDSYLKKLGRRKCLRRISGRMPTAAYGVKRFVERLREHGVIVAHSAETSSAADEWLVPYAIHLERLGLSNGTRRMYMRFAGSLLDQSLGSPTTDGKLFTAEKVTVFVRDQAAVLKPASCRAPVTATRVFLRYLAMRDVVPATIVSAVPTIRQWKLAELPKYLTENEVGQILSSCEDTPVGRRDRAILKLLVRLGLRAGEVVQLRLDDIDWREGCVRIRAGKSAKERVLPLLEDVALDLVAYLRDGRPKSNERAVFLKNCPPYKALKCSACVSSIATTHIKRAGIIRSHYVRAHVSSHGRHTDGFSRCHLQTSRGHSRASAAGDDGNLRQAGSGETRVCGHASAGRCAMNSAGYSCHLDLYLELRRAVGFAMRVEERLLRDFLRYIDHHECNSASTAQLAVDWACSIQIRPGSGTHAGRLSVVRGFLTYLQSSLPDVRVPDANLVAGARRPKPYIFSAGEIRDLMNAAQSLGPQESLRPLTYVTLIGLVLSCGLRAGEAMRLDASDVILDTNPPHLVVRQTKFRKSRLVPMHSTTAESMRVYAVQRQRLGYDRVCDAFFVSENGKPLVYQTVARNFIAIARRLGIRGSRGERGASLHSLRHTFTVSRMLAWYRDGVDVQARLPELSVYLGHVRPQETYWYLTATPELLTAASVRFENYSAPGIKS